MRIERAEPPALARYFRWRQPSLASTGSKAGAIGAGPPKRTHLIHRPARDIFPPMSAQTPPRRTWICGSEPECRRWRDRSATPRGQRRGSSSSAGTLSGYPHSSVSMSLTGSCFSSESAPRLFHHGIRERGGTIFRAALPSHERRQVSIGRGGLGRQNIATSSSRTMANRRCSLLFRWGYFLNADLINQMLSAQIR